MGKENQKHCVFGRRIDRRNGLDFHCIKKSSFLYSRPCNLDLFYLNLSIVSSLNLSSFAQCTTAIRKHWISASAVKSRLGMFECDKHLIESMVEDN